MRSNPISTDELRNELKKRDTNVVYSFSNVLETVDFGDNAEIRRRLELLQSLPSTFIIGLPPLIKIEFLQALMAFWAKMQRTPPVLPFREQWHQILSTKPLPPLKNYSLIDIVLRVLAHNPGLGKNTVARLRYYMGEVGADRARSPAERQGWNWFRGGVANTLINCGFGNVRQGQLDDFCKWLAKRGDACPAWKLFRETQAAFTNNVGDGGQRGDPPDYSHVTAVPYVDSATLDNRMRAYCLSAIRKLEKQYPKHEFIAHCCVLRNLEEWL
ncbi:MAG TPA: hypothetical protein VFS76_13485 [Pyrinomonadaceae bacterium]|nr:hypothetical protein [Pyrinomonadaceae bacterium]